jgi:hypothetical protein
MIRAVYHFLGSISFALLLIASVATLVIFGTVIESKTDSHRYAASLTYGHPFFAALLWGFFINILVSALRRWPFQKKHLPFLITHFGLLMILGGALIKSSYGTQGTMQLLEGGSAQKILLPQSYAIKVASREASDQFVLGKDLHLSSGEKGAFPALEIQLVGYAPHATVNYESWIRGNQVFIQGLKPFDVHPEKEGEFPVSSRVRLQPAPAPLWNLFAFHTQDVTRLADTIQKETSLHPALVFAQDAQGVTLYAIDTRGHRQMCSFLHATPQTLVVYDQGYGGYCSLAKFRLGGEEITLESPLHGRYQPQSSLAKWEDNTPLVTLRIKEGNQATYLSLPYDPTALGLKWPALDGKYVLSFQPQERALPYKLRLRQARQLNYPHSNQPFSYESDLVIADLEHHTTEEQTISMNHVHETWDGYRFYLAHMTPEDPGAVKRIQLVINHDPAKYTLTYPGAVFLSLGIFLLFWRRPYGGAR